MDRENQDIKEMLLRQDTKLEMLRTDMVDLKVQGAKQNEQLAEHIRRTGLAEENIEMIRQENQLAKVQFEAELKPIKTHVLMVSAFLKIMGVLFTGAIALGGLVIGLIKLMKGIG